MTVEDSDNAKIPPNSPPPNPATPLAGMRVIELSSFVASPLGGMTLAQLGAEVIRVDPVGGGPDRNRWPLAPTGESIYWAGLNKGKRSVTVDTRSEEGRALVADLIEASGPRGGIVLTNGPQRSGLSFEDLRGRRPDVIHVQLRGDRNGGAAVDYTVNAASGFPALTGPKEHGGPVNHVLPAWDIASGLYLCVALLAAERHRMLTGQGQQVRVSLEDVALATAGNLGFLAEAQFGAERPRLGNHLYGGFGRDFESADGHRVMILALTTRHWRDLVEITGMTTLLADLATNLGADFEQEADRYEHRDVLAALLATWFGTRSQQEIVRALEKTSVLWSPYRTFRELVEGDGELLRANPMMSDLDQPGIGEHLAPGPPVMFDGQQLPPVPAPKLGEDTDDVLGDWLSLTPEEVADLRSRNVAGERR